VRQRRSAATVRLADRGWWTKVGGPLLQSSVCIHALVDGDELLVVADDVYDLVL
jgi:hypothetical protein